MAALQRVSHPSSSLLVRRRYHSSKDHDYREFDRGLDPKLRVRCIVELCNAIIKSVSALVAKAD